MRPLPAYLWALGAFIVARSTWHWVRHHILLCGYALTRSHKGAILISSIILFPGTILHELSHWITCKLLRVRTLGISVFPSTAVQEQNFLGWVIYDRHGVGPLRRSLIGVAPLVTGSIALLLITNHLTGFSTLASVIAEGQIDTILALLGLSLKTPGFLLWLYLAFAIANSMEPSLPDREAWPITLIGILAGSGLMIILGAGRLVKWFLNVPAALGATYLAAAFTIAAGINLLILLGLFLFEQLLGLNKQ